MYHETSHDLIAEQTHEIPLEGVDNESVGDYRLLIDEMLKFVSHGQLNFPPLFVKVTMLYGVIGHLLIWHNKAISLYGINRPCLYVINRPSLYMA